MKLTAIALLAPLLAIAGCSPPPPQSAPAPSPAPGYQFSQFAMGDSFDLVREKLGLDKYVARYRSGLPADLMGVVYFVNEGNLHVDLKKDGDAWVLVAPPLLDPSTVPVADRVAEWDRGADQQNLESKGLK